MKSEAEHKAVEEQCIAKEKVVAEVEEGQRAAAVVKVQVVEAEA